MKIFSKYILMALLLLILSGGISAWHIYRVIFTPVESHNIDALYVTEDDTLESLYTKLNKAGFISKELIFYKVAQYKRYNPAKRPGRYEIGNVSLNALINKLKIGDQDAIDFTFVSTRNIHEIMGKAEDKFLYLDSLTLCSYIMDESNIKALGFNRATLPALFIPNTYKMFWTTDKDEFFQRMKREFYNYWNESRIAKAKALGLTPIEIATLASIIDEESQYIPEYKRIAGVYINRLKRGMKLEADPTLKFANNDFEAKRVLDKHKQIDSPYNTYKYAGLPPGPIRVPSQQAIDAVLNAENHSYIFFCANADFSGSHVFAKTLSEHNKNAAKYRKALQQRRIYR